MGCNLVAPQEGSSPRKSISSPRKYNTAPSQPHSSSICNNNIINRSLNSNNSNHNNNNNMNNNNNNNNNNSDILSGSDTPTPVTELTPVQGLSEFPPTNTDEDDHLSPMEREQIRRINSCRRQQNILSSNPASLDHYKLQTYNINDEDEYYPDPKKVSVIIKDPTYPALFSLNNNNNENSHSNNNNNNNNNNNGSNNNNNMFGGSVAGDIQQDILSASGIRRARGILKSPTMGFESSWSAKRNNSNYFSSHNNNNNNSSNDNNNNTSNNINKANRSFSSHFGVPEMASVSSINEAQALKRSVRFERDIDAPGMILQ